MLLRGLERNARSRALETPGWGVQSASALGDGQRTAHMHMHVHKQRGARRTHHGRALLNGDAMRDRHRIPRSAKSHCDVALRLQCRSSICALRGIDHPAARGHVRRCGPVAIDQLAAGVAHVVAEAEYRQRARRRSHPGG